MVPSRDSRWFFKVGEVDVSDAEILKLHGGSERNVLRLLHEAVEMLLKAAMISRGLWDGRTETYKTHNIKKLAGALRNAGVNVPPVLLGYINSGAQVPRSGEGPCETHCETGYADNLDWALIPPDSHWSEVARRTREWVWAEFPQLRP